jgi:molybdopterin converting factor small subunit
MEVEVKLFAIFQDYLPQRSGPYSCKLRVESEAQVEDVLNYLNLPKGMAKILLLNGIQCKPESKLREGDVLSIFPPLEGG